MSKVSGIRPLPRLRPLPRHFEHSAIRHLAPLLSGLPRQPADLRYPTEFLDTSAAEVINGLTTAPYKRGHRDFSPSHSEMFHARAKQLAELVIDLPTETGDNARLLLALIFAAAEVANGPVRRVVFWLDRIEEDETLKELNAVFDYRRADAGAILWADFARRPVAERVAAATVALQGLSLVAAQMNTVDAGHLNEQAAAALTIAGCTHKRTFKDFWSDLFSNHAQPEPALVCWRKLVVDGEGPAAPVQHYRVLAPEKHAEGNSIVFSIAGYRWQQQAGWHRQRSIFIPGVSDSMQRSWPASTEIDTLSSTWADWTHAVSVYNQQRFVAYQQALEAEQHARTSAAELKERRAAELHESDQIAGLLPGGTTLAPKA